jgi:hypothetical protein
VHIALYSPASSLTGAVNGFVSRTCYCPLLLSIEAAERHITPRHKVSWRTI